MQHQGQQEREQQTGASVDATWGLTPVTHSQVLLSSLSRLAELGDNREFDRDDAALHELRGLNWCLGTQT